MLRSPAGGLTEVLAHIDTTLPLLRGFSNVESTWETFSDEVSILPRSTESYIMRYHNPNGKVEINLHDRKGEILWLVKERGAQKEEARDEGFEKSLRELTNSSGEQWRGMNGSMVAKPGEVENLIGKINQLFWTFKKEHKPPTPNPRKRKAENTDQDVVELSE